jgi:hypothetical protein
MDTTATTTATTDEVDAVQQFATCQLRWLARRGSKNQRRAARIFADLIPRLADPVRKAMAPTVDDAAHNPAA